MHTKSIDFVQVYPQADIKVTIYLHTPQGIDLGGNNKDVVLKLKKNLDGLKDAGLTWWEMISKGLLDLGECFSITYLLIKIRRKYIMYHETVV